jgi:TolB-like protein
MSGLFSELKRRNVFRVAAAYAVAGWLLTEVASVVLPTFDAPDWVLKVLIALMFMGFPLALIFSWVYELTPDGLKREVEVAESHSITHETSKRLDIMTMGLIVVAISFVVVNKVWWQVDAPTAPRVAAQSETPLVVPITDQPAETRQSVAVLPFVNMSDGPGNEYFSDGISEELLNVLVKVKELRVPSRTSSFTFKNKDMRIADIARELGVDHVLEGSVRKAGNQVRVTAQLIDVGSDTHLWSETYTRTLDDIFAIQDEIARAIVDALKVTLGAETSIQSRSTSNSEAYNHYLKGRFFWHQRSIEGFASAERELQAALALDTGYSDAWAALADVFVLKPEYGLDDGFSIPQARAALERALTLNPDSAHALTTRAYMRALHDWDWQGSESDFKRAIALDPGYATAYQWYAETLQPQRRFEEAEELARKAMELDPLAPVKPLVVANILSQSGRIEDSIAVYEQVLTLSPGWFNGLGNLASVRMALGQYEEARKLQIQAAEDFGQDIGSIDYVLATIDGMAGKIPLDEAIQLVTESPNGACNSYDKPMFLASLGAHEHALDMLEQCLDDGIFAYSPHINNIVAYEPMRQLPRFQALLRRMNLAVED